MKSSFNKRAMIATLLGTSFFITSACSTLTGIPGHGGGKRFSEEQRLVSSSIRQSIKQIDVSGLYGRDVAIVFGLIADEGGGNIVGGRASITALLTQGQITVPTQSAQNTVDIFQLATGSSGSTSETSSSSSTSSSQTDASSSSETSESTSGTTSSTSNTSSSTSGTGTSNTSTSGTSTQDTTNTTNGSSTSSTDNSSTSVTDSEFSTDANQTTTTTGTSNTTGTNTSTTTSAIDGTSTGTSNTTNSTSETSTSNTATTGSTSTTTTGNVDGTSTQSTDGTTQGTSTTTGASNATGTSEQAIVTETRTDASGTQSQSNIGISYEGLGQYQNIAVPKSDAAYLMSQVRNHFLLNEITVRSPADPAADAFVYVSVDILGTNRQRTDLFIYNQESLRAETHIEMFAIDRTGRVIMEPQIGNVQTWYKEDYIIWSGPYNSRRGSEDGIGLIEEKQYINYGPQVGN